MATETITLRLVAQDLMSGNVTKAIGTLDKLSKQSGLAGWAVKGAALSMGAMLNPALLLSNAIGAVTDVLGDATTAFREDQTSQEKLRAALDANIEGWNGNTEAIEKVINSRVRLGFSDDEQRSSLALLVAQVEDVNDALAIQRTAMDLARLKGISLADASTLLAKAYLGSTTGLQKMGIQLKKGTDGLEAIAAVQQRASGQAEAYGKTSAGAAAAFDAKVGELQESLGALVDGPARGFITFLDNVVSRIVGQGGTTLSENMQLLIDDVKGLDDAAGHAASTGVRLFSMSLDEAEQKLDNLVTAGRANGSHAGEMLARLGPQFLVIAENVGVTGESLFALASAYEKAGRSQEEFRSAAIAATNNTRSTVTSMVSAWTLGMGQVEDTTEETKSTIRAFSRVVPKYISHAVIDMRDTIKNGKGGIIEQFRDLAWQSKHPFAQKNYEEWLRERQKAALRKMRQAEKAGHPGLVEQYRQLAADIQGELQGLPGYMRSIAAQSLGALSVIPGFGNLTTVLDLPTGGGGGNGGGGGHHGNRNRHRNRHGNGGGNGNNGVTVNVMHLGSISEADGQRLAQTIKPHLDRHNGRNPS